MTLAHFVENSRPVLVVLPRRIHDKAGEGNAPILAMTKARSCPLDGTAIVHLRTTLMPSM